MLKVRHPALIPELRAPSATLFDAPFGRPEDVVGNQIGVVGMPSDWTHSSRIGARLGPRALRRATTELLMTSFDLTATDCVDPDSGAQLSIRRDSWIVDCGDAEIDPISVEHTTEAIARMTCAVRMGGGVPLSLGGDHYNSYPACLGYSRALSENEPEARFGYIQMDGHLDFSDKLGAWGAFNHATNGRRISELPNVIQGNMVWIGITGWVDSGDLELIENMGGRIFSSGDVRRLGAEAVARQAVAHAMRGVDRLYLSIDIDAMDAGFLPGTGSVVHSGITPRQYCRMLDIIGAAPIDGLDIAEVAPSLDPSGRTERIAAHMLFRVLRNRMFVSFPAQSE